MSKSVIITVASWEPRFVDSLRVAVAEENPLLVEVLYSTKYREWTAGARRDAKALALSAGAQYHQQRLDFESPAALWQGVAAAVRRAQKLGIERVIIDGTTMPREVTWYLLHVCGELGTKARYLYVPVGKYGPWLSKESLRPRLVLKRSGVLLPDRPTAVVAISGYDIGRLNQMLIYFEPRKIAIARQVGDRYDNLARNITTSDFTRHAEVFDFDGFDLSGHSLGLLNAKIRQFGDGYNVLLASLGPKLSSVTAFLATVANPEVALVYVPSESYNKEYSKGADLDRRVVNDVALKASESPLEV
jgi:hypothetical protein